MAKLTHKLQVDKRTKIKISANVHQTKIYLYIGNVSIKLSSVEAQRVNAILHKALMIQLTNKRGRIEV